MAAKLEHEIIRAGLRNRHDFIQGQTALTGNLGATCFKHDCIGIHDQIKRHLTGNQRVRAEINARNLIQLDRDGFGCNLA